MAGSSGTTNDHHRPPSPSSMAGASGTTNDDHMPPCPSSPAADPCPSSPAADPSPAADLQLRIKRLLSEGHDSSRVKRTCPEDGDRYSPKSKQRHMDESASPWNGDDDESSRAKRFCTEFDGGYRHKSKKAHIYEGAAAAAADAATAAAAEWGKDWGFLLDIDARDRLKIITGFQDVSSPKVDEVDLLEQEYIVVEDKDPKTILERIEQILSAAAKSSLDGKGYSFTLPLRSSKNLTYFPQYGFVYKSGGNVTYDFSKDTQKTVALTCVLSVIADTIRQGITITNRDLFYCYKDIFGKQEVSDAMVANVCCWFGCTKSSLRVISESKGSVVGPLNFILKTGKRKSCSELEADRIPCLLSEIETFEHEADFILLIEKKSIFHNLLQMRFHVKNKCIMITGSGQPDIATRKFLKRLHSDTNLPVYAFMDPDPYGIQILFVYAFGSLNMSYARMELAVPAIRWIGLFPQDLLELGISHTYFSLLTSREKTVLTNLLKQSEKFVPNYWVYKILSMKDTKASTEAVYSMGISYMSDVLLPKLIGIYRAEPVTTAKLNAFELAIFPKKGMDSADSG